MNKSKFKKIKSDISGYSLAEVMTAVSIVVIISSIYIANIKSGQEGVSVKLGAQKIVGIIRSVQNDSLAQKVPVGSVSPPIGGWGIYFQRASSSCYIFRDNGDGVFALPGDAVERVVAFDQGVTITDIKKESPYASVNDLSIIFLPPDPEVLFGVSGFPIASASSTLVVNNKKQININQLGLIDAN